MLNVAIVEDEVPALHRLTNMLATFQPEISVDVVASTGKEAIAKCVKYKPQLVFLDIHLPDMKGFQVIESLDYSPYVIFTTAYANYAIRAFETWAVDYLLKPYSQKQLHDAIHKYISIKSQGGGSKDVDWNEVGLLFNKEKNRSSFTVKNGARIILVDYQDIAYISAEDKYTKIYMLDGRVLFCDYSLKEIEQQLNSSFLRIHRSTIINVAAIEETRKTFKGRYIFFLNSDKVGTVRSGASYKDGIVALLKL